MAFDIANYLKKRGFAGVDSKFRSHISEWLEWYQGEVASFHKYTIYNGKNTVSMTKKSLQMAKFICEDWANLLLNEHVTISVADGFQEKMQQAIDRADWCTNANKLVELAFAAGTGAFVEYKGAGGLPEIEFIRADMIHPLSWNNRGITECAFGSVQRINGKEAVYLMIHRLEKGQYVIENRLFDNETGNPLPLPDGVLDVVPTGSAAPLFQIITPCIENNVDLDCPMGISVFANSIPVLKALDNAYDSMDNEFTLGRKRVTIPMSYAKIQMDGQTDEQGNPIMKPVFDPRDVVFYALDTEEKKPHEINMALRIQEHSEGISSNLALLGKKCGLGFDRYMWDKTGGVKTAKEVVSEKSDLYQNKRKHEHPLENAICGMVEALAFLLGFQGDLELKISFDDSIIQDAQSDRQEAREEVSSGLRSVYDYLLNVRHLSEEDVQKELQRIRDEKRVDTAAVDQFLSGNDQFDPPGGDA